MMVRLFQITRLSNQLMPTTSAPVMHRFPPAKSSPHEVLSSIQSRARKESVSRTNEDSSPCSLMRGERNTLQGWWAGSSPSPSSSSPQYTPHTSRWHSSNYVFPDLSRLPTVPNIAESFSPRLIPRAVFHLTPPTHAPGCHSRSLSEYCLRVPEGYKLPSWLLPTWTSLSLATRSRCTLLLSLPKISQFLPRVPFWQHTVDLGIY